MNYQAQQLINSMAAMMVMAMGAIVARPVMLQLAGSTRTERTTTDKIVGDLERTWHRIAPDMSIRMQSALSILKNIMGYYYDEPCIAIWDDSNLVGVAVYESGYDKDRGIRYIALKELASFTHKPGVGKALVAEVIKIAKEESADNISVASAPGARKFYEGLGFRKDTRYLEEPSLMVLKVPKALTPEVTISIKQVPPAPMRGLKRGNFVISKGGKVVGTMDLGFLPEENVLRLRFLAIDKPGILNRGFLNDLWNKVDQEARARGLAFTEIRPLPKQEKMYLTVGFSKHTEAGEVVSLRRPVKPITPVTPEVTEQVIHSSKNKYGVEQFYIIYDGKRYDYVSGYKSQVKFRDFLGRKEIEGLVYPSYAYMEEGTVLHMKPAIPKAENRNLPQVEQPTISETKEGFSVFIPGERASATLSWLEPQLFPDLNLGLGKWLWFNRLINQSGKPGLGTLLLDTVLSHCEKNQYSILNEVNAYGALSQRDLENWYISKGFKPIDYKRFKNTFLVWRPTK